MPESDRIEGIDRPGVLNPDQIQILIKQKIIDGWSKEKDKDIDGSSFDLHISKRYWKLPAGFKCGKRRTIKAFISSAKQVIKGISPDIIRKDGLVIYPKKTCLFKLQEEISLKGELYGQGSGKSTIGRLDVLTRLLADKEEKYDCLNPGNAKKRLYVEVTPLSFPIILYEGDPIYQLRIAYGEFDQIQVQRDMLKLYPEVMRDKTGTRFVPHTEQTCLRLNLEPINTGQVDGLIAYRAKNFSDKQPRHLDPLHPNAESGTYDPREYWDCITISDDAVKKIGDRYSLKVTRDDFYILRSSERFTLPDDIAVYGIAMTEEVGELRIHHAGFVHPLFGSKRPDHKGTPLIFEVRGHDIDMYLTDSDLMAKLRYYPMSKPIKPKKKLKKQKDSMGKDPYEEQELKLSKIFKDFKNASGNHKNRKSTKKP